MPKVDLGQIEVKNFANWRVIPERIKKSLRNMHYRKYGLMVHQINRPDKAYMNIGVLFYSDIPVAWYTITNTNEKHIHNVFFWVKHKFRGNGLGLMMLKLFAKQLKKVDKKHRHKKEFKMWSNMWDIYLDHQYIFSKSMRNILSEGF